MTTVISRLEQIIGEEKTGKLVNNRIYKWGVDAVANNLFSLSYALNEKFIAGMTWEETGKARLAAAIGNAITGRPYGLYKDYMINKLNITKDSNPLKKYLADVFIFVTGQTPIYLLYLTVAGADYDNMVKGATFLTLVAPLAATPQNETYNYCREQFGIKYESIDSDNI